MRGATTCYYPKCADNARTCTRSTNHSKVVEVSIESWARSMPPGRSCTVEATRKEQEEGAGAGMRTRHGWMGMTWERSAKLAECNKHSPQHHLRLCGKPPSMRWLFGLVIDVMRRGNKAGAKSALRTSRSRQKRRCQLQGSLAISLKLPPNCITRPSRWRSSRWLEQARCQR